MKNTQFRTQSFRSGFTLIETLVSLSVMLFVVAGLVSLIMTNQRQHIRENLKQEMVSSTRNFQSFLNEDLRNAGSILTLLHTPTFLGQPSPFTGILPLNNDNFPDGVILAAGDQQGSTELTADYSAGNTVLSVKKTSYIDPVTLSEIPAWAVNDIGLIARPDGFWVFTVTQAPAVGDTSLSVRSAPVYFSGLLNTDNYDDFLNDQLGGQGTGTYLSGSPVIRLHYFHIYMVRVDQDKEGNDALTLTVTTDTLGNLSQSDLENASGVPTIGIPLIENIVDFQIEYLTQDGFFWASLSGNPNPCSSSASADCISFREQFSNRNIGGIRVYLLTETELDKSISGTPPASMKWDKPAMGDASALTDQPEEKRRRIYYEFDIAPRNFRIVY